MVKNSEEPKKLVKTNNKIPNYSLLIGLTCICSIMALILASYPLLVDLNEQKKALIKNKAQSIQIEQFNQKQVKIQEQMDEKARAYETTQDEFKTKIAQLEQHVQTSMTKATDKSVNQTQDWQLQKTRYYLDLAQINTYWTNDFNASITLLQHADSLLKQFSGPKILDIRQAIAKEIAQLKAIPILDTVGLLSQLSAIQTLINKLALQSTNNKNEVTIQADPSEALNASAWRMQLQNSVNVLEKLVIIRRDHEEVTPLLSPLLVSILRESIRLDIQQAQWAILNREPVVYQLALKQALLNLKRTFNEKNQGTQTLIKQLTELQQIQLTQEKPDNELALTLLNQLIGNPDSGKK